MKSKLLLPLVLSPVLFLSGVLPLQAKPIPQAPEETLAPASEADVAYWRMLQSEIAALRSANTGGDASSMMGLSLVEINDHLFRVEDFLDAREDDPVESLSEPLQQYRQTLIDMLDQALGPLTSLAGAKEDEAILNPQARAMAIIRFTRGMEVVDEFKGTLARLHADISKSVEAAGGPKILFFATLNMGDSAYFSLRAGMTPAERDARFVQESQAIDPNFAVLVEEGLLPMRRDNRTEIEIGLIRDNYVKEIENAREMVLSMPPGQFEAQLKNLPPDISPVSKAIFQLAFNLEQLRQEREMAYSLKLQDWQTAFNRWLGEAKTDPTFWEACRDLTASFDGGRYAYSIDGETVVVRSTETHEILNSAQVGGQVRGLAYDSSNALIIFSTNGLYQWQDTGSDDPELRNETASENVTGRIAASADLSRYIYGWADMFEFSYGGLSTTFGLDSSSNVSAVALTPDGQLGAVGFTGANNLGSDEETQNGALLIPMPEALGEDGTQLRNARILPPFIEAVTSVAFKGDQSMVAMSSIAEDGRGTIVTYALTEQTVPRNRRVVTMDDQPYHFTHFAGKEKEHLLAAAKNGVIRIWDTDSLALTHRTVVPTGPRGVAVGIAGNEVITVALGAEDVHRWSAEDLSYLGAVAGTAPVIDEEALSGDLAAEQALRPVIEELYAFVGASDDEKIAMGKALLREQAEAIDRLGRRTMIRVVVGTVFGNRIEALRKEDKNSEAYEMGRAAIRDGFVVRKVYSQTALAMVDTAGRQEAIAFIDEGLERFPTSTYLRYLKHFNTYILLRDQGNPQAAMKEIDEIDQIYPDKRPHPHLRRDAWARSASNAYNAGNLNQSLDFYMEAYKWCRTKEEQVRLLGQLWPISVQAQNWQIALNVANTWLGIDPNKKNDQNFMHWARHAYQQVNP